MQFRARHKLRLFRHGRRRGESYQKNILRGEIRRTEKKDENVVNVLFSPMVTRTNMNDVQIVYGR